MAKPLSLEEYCAVNPPNAGGKPCWACSIPEAAEINAARLNGRTISRILGWLRDVRGYQEVTKGKLEGHFVNNRHHERTK